MRAHGMWHIRGMHKCTAHEMCSESTFQELCICWNRAETSRCPQAFHFRSISPYSNDVAGTICEWQIFTMHFHMHFSVHIFHHLIRLNSHLFVEFSFYSSLVFRIRLQQHIHTLHSRWIGSQRIIFPFNFFFSFFFVVTDKFTIIIFFFVTFFFCVPDQSIC